VLLTVLAAFLVASLLTYSTFAIIGKSTGAALLLALGSAVSAVQLALSSMIRAHNQFTYQHRQMLAAELSRSVGVFGGALMGVFVWGTGAMALVASALLGTFALLPFGRALPGFTNVIQRTLRPGVAAFARQSAKYGYPIVLVSVSLLIVQFSDRIILTFAKGEAIAASYAATYDIVNRPIGLVIGAIAMASQRSLFDQFDSGSNTFRSMLKKDVRLQVVIAAVLGLFLILCLWLSVWVRDLVLGDQSYLVALLIFVAAVALGLTHTVMRPLQATRSTGRLALFAFMTAVVNVVVGVPLIALLGPVGAATSTALSFIGLALVLSWGNRSIVLPGGSTSQNERDAPYGSD